LAESWTTSSDGVTYTFKLRSGAVWSDGQPITSKDAAFTLNTILGGLQTGLTVFWGPNVSMLAKVEAPDDLTLVVTLAGPSPESLVFSNLSEVPILPEHAWGPLAAGDGSKLKTATMDPTKEDIVVAGPFTIAKLDLQGTTLFKRVDTFYGDKPLITGWGAVSLTNVDAAIQALKNGDIDVLADVPPSGADALTADANLVTKGIGTSPSFLAINYSKDYAAHPELSNVKVREAMNLAVDREQIVSAVYRDFATSGGFILPPPFAPGFMSTPAPVPAFDTAQANSILDGLGFAKGGDGIRVANGVKMDYTVLVDTPGSAVGSNIVEIVKQGFAEIGMNLTLKVLDDPYTASFAGEKAYQDYDMIWLWVGMYPDPQRLLAYEASMGLGRFNFTGYSNPAYDDLFEQQGVTVDATQRKALIDQMATMLQQDQVYVGLAYFQNVAAWNKKWQNIEDLSGRSDLFDVRNNWAFNRLYLQE
jgi:peptide/nickel transport system substrate-binding protein